MSVSPAPAESASPDVKAALSKTDVTPGTAHSGGRWKKYFSPILVVLLALAILMTITRNWNAWEGGKVEQVTDDAYVRGDLTPLSTKVPGIVHAVHVEDFQQVRQGDLIVELDDDDYRAQVDQASAGVTAAHAADC